MAAILSGLAKFAFGNLRDALTGAGKKYDGSASADAISDISANSLVELSNSARVEPIVVVDSALTLHDSTTDVLKFLNSLYAAFYISASSIVTDTGRVKTVKLLEKLNPSKSPSYALANGILSGSFSNESFEPTAVELPKRLPTTLNISTESDEQAAQQQPTKKKEYSATGHSESTSLAAVANLSVGQLITITVSDGEASRDVVVQLRFITVPVRTPLLKTILTWSSRDNRLKTRLSAWRAGELAFWRDVIFMRDIYVERKRLLMNDKSDVIQTMLGRQKDSMLHSVMTATPSVGTVSSVAVVSADSLNDIEGTIDGRLSNFKVRQRVMNATGIMLLAVVDPITEFVTVYTYSQALPAEYSLKQLKAASKGGASELGELIKLMNQNQMPSF